MRRLAGIAAGVALGTGMLLILLGTYLHMPERDDRSGWSTPTGASPDYGTAGDLVAIPPTDDRVLVAKRAEYVHGSAFDEVVVAATSTTHVTFPAGLSPLAPGQYYASPALARLVAKYPSNELADRLGAMKGVLPQTALKGPDQVIALVAEDWGRLSADPNARLQQRFPDKGPHATSQLYRVILGVGSVALLVPIALLIGIVSQLGAAARRERYATVRLIGAGRKAMATLAALEMGVASLIGGIAGVGVAFALRPAAALMPLNGTQSYESDLTPSLGWIVVSILAMTALGAGTAWWRAFRDEHGALGATRERAEKPATWRRVIVLVVGLAVFTSAAALAAKNNGGGAIILLGLVGGFAAVAFGIVLAGSWLTKVASGIFARVARSAPSLVAAGRLSRHPRATFRSVAGVVVAVFIVSALAGVVSSVNRIVTPANEPGLLPLNAVVAMPDTSSDPGAMASAARATEGVERTIIGYDDGHQGLAVVTADEAKALGARDVPDTPYVAIDLFLMLNGGTSSDGVRKAVAAPAPRGADAVYVVALTNGSAGAIDRAATALEVSGNLSLAPVTRAEFSGAATLDLTYQLAMLAYIGMAIAVGISALSLTVATVAAALDRRRTFGLLRLGGMSVGGLRRTIVIEAAMPLAVT